MKVIHVEASTYCNARCPLCPRSLFGYKVEGVYPELHLNTQKFADCLDKFPNRQFVYFNGNLGDPMMNPNILALTDMTKCLTSITTNGSIGNEKTWMTLAKNNIQVVFSIDGLEDTNHLYRQDVDWQKLLERIDWFIGSGGHATWKWINFKHNKHQVEQARTLSKDLQFKKFIIEDHGRNYGPALDKNAKITHWILPHDDSLQPTPYDVQAGIDRYKQTHDNFKLEDRKYEVSCEHLEQESIYIDAHGRIAPCCYQGFDLPDLPFRSMEDFQNIKKTWDTNRCDKVCAQSCGR